MDRQQQGRRLKGAVSRSRQGRHHPDPCRRRRRERLHQDQAAALKLHREPKPGKEEGHTAKPSCKHEHEPVQATTPFCSMPIICSM
jgi:hypothetical protein